MTRSPLPWKKYSGPSLWELAKVEFRLSIRNGGFRALALLMIVSSVLVVTSLRYGQASLLRVSPSTGDGLRMLFGTLLLFLTPLLVCAAAIREQRTGMSELVLSKPPTSEALGWSKFLGAMMALLLILFLSVMAAWFAQMILCWPDYGLLPLLVGGWRGIWPVLFISGLSFSLATFFRTPMVAGLAIAILLGLLVASSNVIPALQFLLVPYGMAYGLLGVAMVALALGGWERRRDPEIKLPVSWGISLACLILAFGIGGRAAIRWRGWTLAPDSSFDGFAKVGKGKHPVLPDAWVKTVSGRPFQLTQWAGKPIVLVFWSTFQPNGASEAAALERAWRDSASDKVGFATVCVTDDPGQAADLARAVGLRAPVAYNPPADMEEPVGLADAFGLNSVSNAMAGVIGRDGAILPGVAQVSLYPSLPTGRPPHLDWERRLYELGKTAFPQLADRSSEVSSRSSVNP